MRALARPSPAALEISQQHTAPISLVLTDVVMPGMSGPELAERLRSDRPQLKVLLMSGYSGEMLVRHGIATGSVEFIEKPYAPAELALKVRQLLDA